MTKNEEGGEPTSLITGVTGQDGSYLAELLLEKGQRVVGVTRRTSTDNTTRLKGVLSNPNFSIVEGDLTDAFSTSSLIKKYQPAYLYNLAAQSHVATSFEQPKYTWEVDALGPLNLLEAIRRESPSTRFYQASTSELFGSEYDIDGHNKYYQDEKTCMRPNSPYAVAKMAAHDLVRIYRDAYGIFGCCGILFNHESPRRGAEFVTRKITKYVGALRAYIDGIFYDECLKKSGGNTNIRKMEDFPKLMLGNLDASRDWGHAKCYCGGMILMMEQEHPKDYVLATGETHTIKELLQIAFDEIGEAWEDFVEIDPSFCRPCEVPYLCGRADRAKRNLGWEPKITFKELISEMVQEDIRDNMRVQSSPFGYDKPKGSNLVWDEDLRGWAQS